MDAFSNVCNGRLGILPGDKVVGVKALQKRDHRRRRDDDHGQREGMKSEEEELIYHGAQGPLPFEPLVGSNESATDPAQGEADTRETLPGPRKVDVVV